MALSKRASQIDTSFLAACTLSREWRGVFLLVGWKKDVKAYSTFLNMLPFTPHTGHFSGASRSTVMPQTGQTK